MGENSRPRRLPAVVAAVVVPVLAGGLLVGCQARPGEAPTVGAPQTSGTSEAATEPGQVPAELRTVSVGVDSIPSDLNPHLAGSRSLATSAVAALTLPSAFTADAEDPDGPRTALNTDLLESVTVTDGTEDAPTAVRYVLRSTAQWSDGTPITGSDFEYLRSQIASQPGVTDPAGYALVDSVDVSGGGRTVDVSFTGPAPDWHELFSDLLPAHIYRNQDSSFATMMSGVPAASGGIFKVSSVDSARGVIELDRNARYWGSTPARTDRIELTVVPDAPSAAQMLRSGQLQMVVTADGAVTEESLGSLPGVQTRTMTRRPDLVLSLNTAAERMATVANRGRVIDALDPAALARILSGDPSATPPGQPGEGGGSAAGSSTGTTDGAAEGASGDTPGDTTEDTTGGATAAAPALPPVGGDLTPLRIGADTSDATAVEAARRIVDQLRSAGIAAEVVARSAADLYGSFLPTGAVDAVVGWQETPETLTELRSRYGCDDTDRTVSRPTTGLPSVTARETTSSSAFGSASDSASGTASASGAGSAEPSESDPDAGEPTETPSDAAEKEAAGAARTVNVSGLCSAEIDGIIDAATLAVADASSSEEVSAVVTDAVSRVEAVVRQRNIDVPLLADRRVIAVGEDLVGPATDLADWPVGRETGPLAGAGQWRRAGEPETSSGTTTAPTTTEPAMTEPTTSEEEKK